MLETLTTNISVLIMWLSTQIHNCNIFKCGIFNQVGDGVTETCMFFLLHEDVCLIKLFLPKTLPITVLLGITYFNIKYWNKCHTWMCLSFAIDKAKFYTLFCSFKSFNFNVRLSSSMAVMSLKVPLLVSFMKSKI